MEEIQKIIEFMASIKNVIIPAGSIGGGGLLTLFVMRQIEKHGGFTIKVGNLMLTTTNSKNGKDAKSEEVLPSTPPAHVDSPGVTPTECSAKRNHIFDEMKKIREEQAQATSDIKGCVGKIEGKVGEISKNVGLLLEKGLKP